MQSYYVRGAIMLATLAILGSPADAQIPDEFHNLQVLPEDITQRELIGIMRGFTRALGVGRCSTCHTVSDMLNEPSDDFASDDKPLKVKARAMLQMVQAINNDHVSQLPHRGEPAFEVTCVTCHSGRRRPTTLQQEVKWALEEGGVDAMTTHYAELRERYFGRGAYNFDTRTMQDVASAIAEERPEDAIAVLDLDLENNPESFGSWNLKGSIYAFMERIDDARAAFEKSLEIAPDNGGAVRGLASIRGGGQ